jgi:hypothetical protein
MLAVGALLIQVSIFETPRGGALSQNIWFNLGASAALGGLVLAFFVFGVAVREMYKRNILFEALENRALEGTQLNHRIGRVAGVSNPKERDGQVEQLQEDATAWAQRVIKDLSGSDRSVLRGHFVGGGEFVTRDYGTGHPKLERVAHFIDDRRVRLADIILRVG